MEQQRRGTVLVELVRLVVVVVCTAAGYEVSRALVDQDDSQRIILGAIVGSGTGYVLGGVFGRTVRTMVGVTERRLSEAAGADLVAGGLGMLAGMTTGTILGWPLLLLPTRAVAVPTLAFLLIVLGSLGYRVAVLKREDILQLFGLTFRTRARDLRVLDTSAILDPRLLDSVRAGFVRGTFLVPEFVLEELQSIADSGEPQRRQRGRRGLEALHALKQEGLVDVRVVERSYPELEQVDAKVVALARDRGAAIVSNDVALRRVAELQGIEVLSLAGLASLLRPPVLPGETVRVELVRRGREPGQAVGYLEDGSMIVVEESEVFVGSAVEATVTSVLQTAGGRMLFARPAEVGAQGPAATRSPSGAEPPAERPEPPGGRPAAAGG